MWPPAAGRISIITSRQGVPRLPKAPHSQKQWLQGRSSGVIERPSPGNPHYRACLSTCCSNRRATGRKHQPPDRNAPRGRRFPSKTLNGSTGWEVQGIVRCMDEECAVLCCANNGGYQPRTKSQALRPGGWTIRTQHAHELALRMGAQRTDWPCGEGAPTIGLKIENPRRLRSNADISVRRAKAWIFSGCDSHPATGRSSR